MRCCCAVLQEGGRGVRGRVKAGRGRAVATRAGTRTLVPAASSPTLAAAAAAAGAGNAPCSRQPHHPPHPHGMHAQRPSADACTAAPTSGSAASRSCSAARSAVVPRRRGTPRLPVGADGLGRGKSMLACNTQARPPDAAALRACMHAHCVRAYMALLGRLGLEARPSALVGLRASAPACLTRLPWCTHGTLSRLGL